MEINQDFDSIINLIKKKFNKKLLKFNHSPTLTLNDHIQIKKCLDSGFISTAGKHVDIFEDKVSKFTSSKYVVSTVSGTSALQISLIVSGVKSDDEVLLPCLSFVATANSILYLKAIPNFLDISNKNLGVCPYRLEKYLKKIAILKNGICLNKLTKRKISALIVVHAYGIPANISKISRILKKYKIKLIEDAAACFGSFYNSKHLGTFGDFGVISLNGNKIISTGGGGVILTKNKSHYLKAKYLTTVAKKNIKFEFIHGELGYNYRMPNLNASLGFSQMASLKKILEKKKIIHSMYKKIFEDASHINLLTNLKNCKSNHWLNTIILDSKSKNNLKNILYKFNKNGIAVRPAWELLPNLEYLKKYPKDNLPCAMSLKNSIINLPSSPNLI